MRYALIATLLAAFCAGLVYNVTWHPAEHERMPVSCNAKDAAASQLAPGQTLKVMTWNIQYLAGKRYVFWYDMADGSGPDERPTPEDVAYNLDEVARVIRDEQPDVVLLQEVDDGAKNTDYVNQLALLQARVTDLYPCSTEAFYWKSDFIPNPHIFGSVGTKLAIISRYVIDRAERLELPSPAGNFISRQFAPRPALLVGYLPMTDGQHLAIVNTHLGGSHTSDGSSKQQLDVMKGLLEEFEHAQAPWVLGGDFSLLARDQYQRLAPELRSEFAPDSELQVLWDRYPMVPSNDDAAGEDRRKWFTRFPNDPRVSGPDRTVDYLFYSPAMKRLTARVRQDDTLLISDHLPVIARLMLPGVSTPDSGQIPR